MGYFIGTLIILSLIAFQDFKSREIFTFLFPVLLFFWLGHYLRFSNWESILYNSLFNLFVLIVCMLCLMWYTKIRNLGFINVSFGLGDLILLVVLGICLPVEAFLFIWTISTVVSLIIQLFKKEMFIAYAGNISAVCIMALLLEHFTNQFLIYGI